MPNLTTIAPKEMLVCKMDGRIEVLIPKRRGIGFLKAPLGHHMNDLARLSHELDLDFVGLDGALEIYGACMSPLKGDDYSAVITQALPAISALNGFPFRVVERAEFYLRFQAATKTGEEK
ncbi:hypothetical protein [Pseudomonas sp. UMAB-40]|uniref:hypothetical protein n=1 Tax=Pseudomonas sp. UMAB-40 TaxID=1365407 RepID=UPI001C58B3C9|nr:hypothetical protein [Pseudomonas sp. UMAB-40]